MRAIRVRYGTAKPTANFTSPVAERNQKDDQSNGHSRHS
jgi:hypothetical protein